MDGDMYNRRTYSGKPVGSRPKMEYVDGEKEKVPVWGIAPLKLIKKVANGILSRPKTGILKRRSR